MLNFSSLLLLSDSLERKYFYLLVLPKSNTVLASIFTTTSPSPTLHFVSHTQHMICGGLFLTF